MEHKKIGFSKIFFRKTYTIDMNKRKITYTLKLKRYKVEMLFT